MLKKVLKTAFCTLLSAFTFVPIAIFFMLSWWLITGFDSWVIKSAGIVVAVAGAIWASLPCKITYFMFREVWDPNFEWEFKIPTGD